jgi:CDP-glycerol glycerophosphotransferase (TagB/SpsB family)
MPHPNVIPHISLFDKHEDVIFFGLNNSYREIYAKSNMILTDYSSAAFDFAYLRKPLAYMHFDYDEFFKGDHVAVPGYFDHERDGFGEVTTTVEETVNLIIEYMENDCKLKDKYRERIDNFFAYNDKNNCQRIFDHIVNQ